MTKTCHACGETLVWPEIYRCYYCEATYCAAHRVAENHDCPKAMAARHIKGDYLRKRGVNITTGAYTVLCDACGYRTGYMLIEQANQLRMEHVWAGTCPESAVKLRPHGEG